VARAASQSFRSLVAVFLFASACASANVTAQTQPFSTNLFLGHWTGTWLDTGTQATGEVDLNVTRIIDDIFALSVKLTNSSYPNWTVDGEVKGETLIVHKSTLHMEFNLHPNRNRMSVTFFNSPNQSRGTWDLRKK